MDTSVLFLGLPWVVILLLEYSLTITLLLNEYSFSQWNQQNVPFYALISSIRLNFWRKYGGKFKILMQKSTLFQILYSLNNPVFYSLTSTLLLCGSPINNAIFQTATQFQIPRRFDPSQVWTMISSSYGSKRYDSHQDNTREGLPSLLILFFVVVCVLGEGHIFE